MKIAIGSDHAGYDYRQMLIAHLEALGHEISLIPAQSPLAGQPGVIRMSPDGSLCGAHDPRSEGCALGV